jgi:hypothetical protein
LIASIEWQNTQPPEPEKFKIVMNEAITALDSWISERM